MHDQEKLKIIRTQELLLDQHGNKSFRVKQSVELTRAAIESGLLMKLPGSLLSVYLYILTHVDEAYQLIASTEDMATYLPYKPIEIRLALSLLEEEGFIQLEDDETQDQLTIILASLPEKIPAAVSAPSLPIHSLPDETAAVDEDDTFDRASQVIEQVLKQKLVSDEDLTRAIGVMIPAHQTNYEFRQEVEYWFNVFEKDVIKELIRRTNEARIRDPELNCQAYMRKITNDWLDEGIISIEDLGKADKIYRETRSLIEEFGVDKYNSMTRTHWETIHRWISTEGEDDFALSIDVARFAIQEAIRRKSDGRPSLVYIQNNFIQPFKEAKVKNVAEARQLLQPKPHHSNSKKSTKNQTKDSKWQVGKDYTRFRKN